MVESITVTWPEGTNQRLSKVKIDGVTLFDTKLSSPATVPGGGSWKGNLDDRTLTAGGIAVLRLEFEADAAPTGYEVTIVFAGGDSITVEL